MGCAMEVFLARQPIFDTKLQVVAYEILYRSSNKNIYDLSMDGDLATTSVVVDSLVNFGIRRLTNGKMAFINFTKKLLMDDLPTLFDKESLTVEILETLEVDAPLVEKCKELKNKGYILALDDFSGDDTFDLIMPYIDIIKVDFQVLKSEGRHYIADKYKKLGVKLLAEKVETKYDYEEALRMGYQLFQGYFFEKPVMCKAKSVQSSTYSYLEVLKETMNEEPDFNRLADIIRKDFSLTYKLLRLINSPAFYTVNVITSINHALTLLGINEIRKWTTLIMLRDLSLNKPDELVKVSLIRAMFAEKIAGSLGLGDRDTEAFFLGLFSLIDTIMEKPLYDIIEPLPLRGDLKSALMGVHNTFHDILLLLKHYEQGNWDSVVEIAKKNDMHHSVISDMYVLAVEESMKYIGEM